MHGTVALVLLAFIAVHACAALYHHFIRRDNVLRNMLPAFAASPRRRELSEV